MENNNSTANNASQGYKDPVIQKLIDAFEADERSPPVVDEPPPEVHPDQEAMF